MLSPAGPGADTVRQDGHACEGQGRRLAVETLRRADNAYAVWFRHIKAGQR